MREIWIIISSFLFVACTQADKQEPENLDSSVELVDPNEFERVEYLGEPTEYDTSKIAVFSTEEVILDSSDLLTLEIVLSHLVDEKALYDNDWPNRNDINGFYRWYVPSMVNNQKTVKIYATCWLTDKDWKNEIPIIQDGGKCYFEVTVNLETKEYYGFMHGSYA